MLSLPCAQFGRITNIDLRTPPRPPAFAFVSFEDPRDADEVCMWAVPVRSCACKEQQHVDAMDHEDHGCKMLQLLVGYAIPSWSLYGMGTRIVADIVGMDNAPTPLKDK